MKLRVLISSVIISIVTKSLKKIFFKTAIILVVFIVSSLHSFAQQNIRGKVIDSGNGVAVANVHIVNIGNNAVVISSSLGGFEVKEAGTYRFTKIGYSEKLIEIMQSNYIIVQLEINPSELNEIIVTANLLPQKLIKTVATVDIISSEDIERGNNINVADILNRVPGVYMQTGALNTNKITIRGIGSRNLYGTSKIKAYFQDIPLTTGSGETTIEDFELSSIARFEIIKGATSSIYGAGLGGTIHLIPKNANLNQTNAESEVTFGSFGLIKGILNVNHSIKNNSFRAIYSNTHSDGYRKNNEYDRQTFTLNSNHFLGDKDDLTFLGSYTDLKAFIPSSVNEETYMNSPKEAAFTWGQAQGFEDSERGIFGLSWKHQYHSDIKQITSIFSSFRNGYEPRPFNILAENTIALGVRSRLLGTTKLFRNNLNWSFGGELFRDMHESGTFENLYKEFPTGTGSVKGNPLSDFKEIRSYYNIFIETNYDISDKTTLSVGLNYNKTNYDLNDRFNELDNPDQSGSYDFGGVVSPKFGVSHLFSEKISVYSNVSHGFSPPTLEETLLPDGLINTEIKPETGWNFEIGARASLIKNRLHFNLALYRLEIQNLLVARRTSEDQFIGVNAGRTQHDGLELTINYKWIQTDNFSLNQFFSYALNDFIFKEFIDDDEIFSGNKLTGIPSDILNTGLDATTHFGLYGNVNIQYAGRIPMTDSNSLFSESYTLANIKFGYRFSISEKLKFNAFLGVDNILDEKYASQILINARGFGGKAPRYYYPGYPINYYTGINVNYMF